MLGVSQEEQHSRVTFRNIDLIMNSTHVGTLNYVGRAYRNLILQRKTEAWKKFVAESEKSLQTSSKLSNYLPSKIPRNNEYLNTDKEIYEHLLDEFFPVLDDPLPNSKTT